ncbi:MAG: hypothetical protein ACRYFZ_00955 [Janthinobacterium lividum]
MSDMTLHRVAGNRPLAVLDLATGQLYVNGPRWDSLTPATRRFVYLHELAHWQTRSDDELLADQLAFAAYVAEGYQPAQAQVALQYVLRGINTDLAQVRLRFMHRRIINY